MFRNNSLNSLRGIHVVNPEEEKGTHIRHSDPVFAFKKRSKAQRVAQKSSTLCPLPLQKTTLMQCQTLYLRRI